MRPIYYFLVLAFLSSCAQKSTEQIELKLNLKPGSEYIINTNLSTAGESMSLYQNSNTRLTVLKDSSNVYMMEVEMLDMQYNSEMFGEKEEYDSKKPKEEMTPAELAMHREFGMHIGNVYTFYMGKNGETNGDFRDMYGYPTDVPPIDLNNIQVMFPEGKKGVGSTWLVDGPNPITGQMTKNTYEIDDITENEIHISVVSEIDGIGGVIPKNTAKGKYVLKKEDCSFISCTKNLSTSLTGNKIEVSYKLVDPKDL